MIKTLIANTEKQERSSRILEQDLKKSLLLNPGEVSRSAAAVSKVLSGGGGGSIQLCSRLVSDLEGEF
jgi:hypothetical protein